MRRVYMTTSKINVTGIFKFAKEGVHARNGYTI